ncbi:hypothetical protein [Nocardia sp. Marseille-Q1738]
MTHFEFADRWSPERVADIRRGAVLQSGGDRRTCIDEVFTVVEATWALASIAGSRHLLAHSGATIEAVATIAHTRRKLSSPWSKSRWPQPLAGLKSPVTVTPSGTAKAEGPGGNQTIGRIL